MNCYDCQQNNDTTAAVVICHECGAGTCNDHATEATQTVATTLPMGLIARPQLRLLRCRTCNEAIAAAKSPRKRAS